MPASLGPYVVLLWSMPINTRFWAGSVPGGQDSGWWWLDAAAVVAAVGDTQAGEQAAKQQQYQLHTQGLVAAAAGGGWYPFKASSLGPPPNHLAATDKCLPSLGPYVELQCGLQINTRLWAGSVPGGQDSGTGQRQGTQVGSSQPVAGELAAHACTKQFAGSCIHVGLQHTQQHAHTLACMLHLGGAGAVSKQSDSASPRHSAQRYCHSQ